MQTRYALALCFFAVHALANDDPLADLKKDPPAASIHFSGQVRSSTTELPSKLAVFADCLEQPRIFGKVGQGLYRIDLPVGVNCTVHVGEQDWDALPLPVQDAATAVALPVLVYPRDIPEPALAGELVAMGRGDQALRAKDWRENDPDFLERAQVADAARQRRLAEIIAAKGWPTLSMVGWEAANAAWLVAQHSPAARLKPWLVLMQAAAARNEIASYNLATSIDRVRINDGKRQLYGTQYHTDADGRNEAYPSEDMEHLYQRRLHVGLPIDFSAAKN